jgi:hypothetical protein
MNQLKRVLTSSICICLVITTAAAHGIEPKAKQIKIRGYITAFTSSNSFEIEDYRITRDEGVELEFENEGSDVKFRPEYLRIGTELEIRGDYNEDTGELRAKKIKIDLEQFKKLRHTAVLSKTPEGLRLTDQGWTGLFFADGRRIRVNPSTKVLFKLNNSEKKLESQAKKDKAKAGNNTSADQADYQPLRSLSDIGPGVIMSYDGTVDEDGTIQASRVEFERNELEKGEAKLRNVYKVREKGPDYARYKAGELTISHVGKFKLLPDKERQDYVTRLGLTLIPKYQRELPETDPQKINFRFYVVGATQPNAFSLANGVVVLNSGIMDVAENEAELASVIGHEIAHSVQEHSWRQMQYHWKKRLALQIGSAVATAYGKRDLAKLLDMIEGATRNGYARSLENQADRLGLEYMVSAGYDPREAPRFWKLMARKLGDHSINLFYSDHDNFATRRSYLMLEIRNNYADLAFNNLKKNDNVQNAVNGEESRTSVDSATKSVSMSQGSRDPVVSQASRDSLGIARIFDQMVANGHPNPETKQQATGDSAPKADAPKENSVERQQPDPPERQQAQPSKDQPPKPTVRVKVDGSTSTPLQAPPQAKHEKIGREMTTEFGSAESFLFARTLPDHFLRATAERKNDADTYYKLKQSRKIIEVRNHSKVRVTNVAKDADGFDVFEVRIVGTGKTVWMESKFLR